MKRNYRHYMTIHIGSLSQDNFLQKGLVRAKHLDFSAGIFRFRPTTSISV